MRILPFAASYHYSILIVKFKYTSSVKFKQNIHLRLKFILRVLLKDRIVTCLQFGQR